MDVASGSVGARVRLVLDEIRSAALRVGRAPEAIRLIAVSKNVPVERLR